MCTRIMTFRLLFFIFVWPAFMATTPSYARDSNTIVIGQIIDLSGPNAAIGRDYVAGITTCFNALNAAGGINGKKIRFITRDDQASPVLAARLASELIETEQVDYLMGGIGEDQTRAILASPSFKRSHLQLYAPLLNNSNFDSARQLVQWRPDYLLEIRHMLAHFGPLGIKRVGIAYQDSADHRQALDSVSSTLKEHGLQLVGTARINSTADMNDSEARKLAIATPDIVIVIGDTINTGVFLKAFRKQAPRVFVAGTSLINLVTLRELAGTSAVEWTVFSQVVPNPHAGKSALQREHLEMMKKYRDEPPSTLTLEGYAVAKTLGVAIQRAQVTGRERQNLGRIAQPLDLGGLQLRSSTGQSLSSYVDIALFSKNGLVF